MKKKILCLFLIVFALVITIGCGGSNADSPLILSSQELDGVFNPFFSSSAPDSQIVGMTQMSMLGNDKSGNVTYKLNKTSLIVRGVPLENFTLFFNTR